MELNNQSKTTSELMLSRKRAFAKIRNKLLHVKVRKEIYFLVGGAGGEGRYIIHGLCEGTKKIKRKE